MRAAWLPNRGKALAASVLCEAMLDDRGHPRVAPTTAGIQECLNVDLYWLSVVTETAALWIRCS